MMPARVKCSSSVWDNCVTANTNTRSKNSSTKVALLCSWPFRLRSICGAACLPAMVVPPTKLVDAALALQVLDAMAADLLQLAQRTVEIGALDLQVLDGTLDARQQQLC